jgi:hypothetical protein
MKNITFQQLHSAFKIYPQQTQALRCRGILPDYPPGMVTRESILALAEYYKKQNRPIGPEADAIIKTAKGSGNLNSRGE